MGGDDCLVEARIPLHVTGLWLPVWTGDPLTTGSLGAGLLLEPGARVVVRRCGGGRRCGVVVEQPGAPPARDPGVALEFYRLAPGASRLSVEVVLPAPLGVGYAGSAAVALGLAAAYAALGRATLEGAARLAHAAEVEAGTGLGDVVAMLQGRGLELRVAPGAPGLARVESVPAAGDVVAAELGPPMETGEMHRGLGERLHELAAPRLQRLLRSPSLQAFLREARELALEAGFISESLAESLDGLVEEGLALGWYAKKRVLIVVARGEAGAVAERLREAGLRPRLFRIAPAPMSVTPC